MSGDLSAEVEAIDAVLCRTGLCEETQAYREVVARDVIAALDRVRGVRDDNVQLMRAAVSRDTERILRQVRELLYQNRMEAALRRLDDALDRVRGVRDDNEGEDHVERMRELADSVAERTERIHGQGEGAPGRDGDKLYCLCEHNRTYCPHTEGDCPWWDREPIDVRWTAVRDDNEGASEVGSVNARSNFHAQDLDRPPQGEDHEADPGVMFKRYMRHVELLRRQRDDWKHRAEMLEAEAERWREMAEGTHNG